MWKCNLRILMAENKIRDIKHLMIKSNLSRNAINKLYNEQSLYTVKMETIIKLCDVFKCKSSEILEYIPDDNTIKD